MCISVHLWLILFTAATALHSAPRAKTRWRRAATTTGTTHGGARSPPPPPGPSRDYFLDKRGRSVTLFRQMPAQASLSSSTTAPTGAEAGCATPATLLLLFIIRLLIAWAEGVAASLRERTETADRTDLLRAFGTTDTALILRRFTYGLQRLRALEADVLRGPPNPDADPQLASSTAAASARSPSAPQPRGITTHHVHILPAPTHRSRTAAPVRATGPPRPQLSPSQPQRGQSILSHEGAWQAPSCRFPLPAVPNPRPCQPSPSPPR